LTVELRETLKIYQSARKNGVLRLSIVASRMRVAGAQQNLGSSTEAASTSSKLPKAPTIAHDDHAEKTSKIIAGTNSGFHLLLAAAELTKEVPTVDNATTNPDPHFAVPHILRSMNGLRRKRDRVETEDGPKPITLKDTPATRTRSKAATRQQRKVPDAPLATRSSGGAPPSTATAAAASATVGAKKAFAKTSGNRIRISIDKVGSTSTAATSRATRSTASEFVYRIITKAAQCTD
ncbi:hypothetical protein FA15DRAFT_731326, partial [Coprinopsis marcescibilis]